MLVLNRRVGSRIFIGEDICITVLIGDHRKNTVRLGVDAPKDVSIMREEVLEREGEPIPEAFRRD